MFKNKFNLRNVVATAICLAVSMMFTACDPKDGDPTTDENPTDENSFVIEVEAKNVIAEENTNNVASVKAFIMTDYIHEEGYVLSSAKFENGGFKLTIPSTGFNLEPIFNFVGLVLDGFGEPIISNTEAKFAILRCWMGGYNAAGEEIGGFSAWGINDNNDEDFYMIWYYVYLDRDCTVKVFEGDYKRVDCSFKKGWNVLYYGGIEEGDFYSTTKPSWANLKWYYGEY